MKATAFRLIEPGQAIRLPRRIESESLTVHEHRIAAVKRLGTNWLMHPAYKFNPRHSNDPNVYGPARAPYLSGIARRAAEANARNPFWREQERVRVARAGT
jgi:hypothetical protein